MTQLQIHGLRSLLTWASALQSRLRRAMGLVSSSFFESTMISRLHKSGTYPLARKSFHKRAAVWSARCKTAPLTACWPFTGTHDPAAAMSDAISRSDNFDAAFGFKCPSSKCAAAAAPDQRLLQGLRVAWLRPVLLCLGN